MLLESLPWPGLAVDATPRRPGLLHRHGQMGGQQGARRVRKSENTLTTPVTGRDAKLGAFRPTQG